MYKIKLFFLISSFIFTHRLTTESNDNIYVVSICQPVPRMFYDPRKLSGAIKLTPEGHTVDLGHIDQSNVIVNGLILLTVLKYCVNMFYPVCYVFRE